MSSSYEWIHGSIRLSCCAHSLQEARDIINKELIFFQENTVSYDKLYLELTQKQVYKYEFVEMHKAIIDPFRSITEDSSYQYWLNYYTTYLGCLKGDPLPRGIDGLPLFIISINGLPTAESQIEKTEKSIEKYRNLVENYNKELCLSDDEKNHILFQYASIKQRIDELQLQLNQIQDSIGISDFSFNHDYTDIYIIVMTSEPIITTWKPITLKYVEEN